jgi:hypothetical protein
VRIPAIDFFAKQDMAEERPRLKAELPPPVRAGENHARTGDVGQKGAKIIGGERTVCSLRIEQCVCHWV